jgi:hypothetical protein
MTISGQRLGKHVHAATNIRPTIELLLEMESFLYGPYQDVLSKAGR